MNVLGQVSLLIAFVCSGYAAFACLAVRPRDRRGISQGGDVAGVLSVLALAVVAVVLARALLVKDFHFAYVAEHSSRRLAWHYSLSALWVGQAGSLLVWACFLGVLALVYRFRPRRKPSELREHVFGMTMAYLCFLVAVMVFGADPMEPSLGSPGDGAGLRPLLQHPAMLIHPPIVLLGYAAWTIPCVLAMAALIRGKLDAAWVREARQWALFAWAVLGGGILWGGLWAYEELGWGGYWSWDPVENGSLIPWLTGTALVHALMAWQSRGVLKKTTVSLAIATFALCNFATFLTRSGVFSSLHAFSQSPIGWMFLVLLVAMAIVGAWLVAARRSELTPDRPIRSIWAREALVLIATAALLLLAAVALTGTVAVPISRVVLGHAIAIGPPFYNNALVPTGLLLLAGAAATPLLRWGTPPTRQRRRLLLFSAGAAAVAAGAVFCWGVRRPIPLVVASLAVLAVAAVAGAVFLDMVQRESSPSRPGLAGPPRGARRQYAGFLIHLGFVLLAVGVTGSSLGTRRQEVLMSQGQTIAWAGRSIRLVGLTQRELPDKLVAEATLQIDRGAGAPHTLLPARHLHLLREEWTSEVAIHSTWSGDLYTILHGGAEDGRVSLTLIHNPLMRSIWMGGWVMGAGALSGALARPATIATAPFGVAGGGKGLAAVRSSPPPKTPGGTAQSRERRMTEKRTAIQAMRLSKVLGGRAVLDRIELEVAEGESVAVTGANGAGKTTLLRLLASALKPTTGEVRWFGRPAAADPAARRLIGVVAHENRLYPHLTLRENLVFAARMCGLRRPARLADRWLRDIGLLSQADRLPARVSRGTCRRAAVARTLMHDPPILLLDEPFCGLDAEARDWLASVLLELRGRKRTLCLALHDEGLVERLADRTLRLRSGRLNELAAAEIAGSRNPLIPARAA